MIDVRGILRDLGITYLEGGTNLRAVCWNPSHHDTNPSMRIHVDTGVFHCFGCGYKGHILSLARTHLGEEYYLTHKHLVDQTKSSGDEDQIYAYLKSSITKRSSAKNSISHAIPLETADATNHPYLMSRNVTNEQIRKWGIGIVKTDVNPYSMYNNWIYIPIIFNHVLRTWFLRSTTANRKLYGYYRDPSGRAIGYSRSDIIFGLDECDTSKRLYLVEGIFDKLQFEKTGRQCGAILGNRILKDQLFYLKNFSYITIVPDNDIVKNDEGLHLVHSSIPLLGWSKVRVCQIPPHRKDAGECTLEELLEATYKEVPLLEFIQTERYLQWFQKTLLNQWQ